MLGSSREALAVCSEYLESQATDSGLYELAGELFSVADLLGSESTLRSALADSGQLTAVRENLARDVFASRIGSLALDVVVLAAQQRWSEDMDLVLALEDLAAQAIFVSAQNDNTLDATEEELFRFGRAVDGSADLQMALTNSASSAQVKSATVRELLKDRSTPATQTLLEYAVGHLHGRRIDSVVDNLVAMAANQRDRVVAEVRVAIELTPEQHDRLAKALSTIKGRKVTLNVAVDPSVLGGAHVAIGDEVIDATILHRLDQARRLVAGQ